MTKSSNPGKPAKVPSGRFDPNRRERILEAAAYLIAERGVHAVRVADIAERIGTTTGTVHYYFPFKDDVLRNAIDWAVQKAFERQDAILTGVITPKEKLLRIMEIQLPSSNQSHDEWSIWLQYWSEASLRPELRQDHIDLNQRWRKILIEIVKDGQKEGEFQQIEPKFFVDHMQALFNGLGIEVLVGASDLDHMRQIMVDFVRSNLFVR
ncbi:MAG TPA: TetR/AcrR family transcriptional regulator [Candidatus Nanopelagicaceae bacterium]